jgi:hypothetical protein
MDRCAPRAAVPRVGYRIVARFRAVLRWHRRTTDEPRPDAESCASGRRGAQRAPGRAAGCLACVQVPRLRRSRGPRGLGDVRAARAQGRVAQG